MPSVVVVGSGAAGLAAALAAADAGADTVVLERAERAGGTTALSGGVVWAPCNRYGAAGDDAAAALTYLSAISQGDVEPALLEAFVADAARVVEEIEQRTPLRWEGLPHWPDYHSDFRGGRRGGGRPGRSIWPLPLTLPTAVADRVQRAVETAPRPVDDPTSDASVFRGPVRGQALVGGLLAGLDDARVEVRTGVRVEKLVVDDGRVTGVVAGGERVQGSVVLATGGFQHDPALRAAFLTAAEIVPMGTPGCDGGGLRMAMTAGAALGNMADGWWMPALGVPGESLDGVPHFRPLHAERAQPGSIMVDRDGRRFVDEAQNYCDVGRAMQRFDARGYRYPASPCWLLFDSRYRARYAVGPLAPGDPDPAWIHRGADLHASSSI